MSPGVTVFMVLRLPPPTNWGTGTGIICQQAEAKKKTLRNREICICPLVIRTKAASDLEAIGLCSWASSSELPSSIALRLYGSHCEGEMSADLPSKRGYARTMPKARWLFHSVTPPGMELMCLIAEALKDKAI